MFKLSSRKLKLGTTSAERSVWLRGRRRVNYSARQAVQLIKQPRYARLLKNMDLLSYAAIRTLGSRFIRPNWYTVPYTNRKQLLVTTSRHETRLGERAFERAKNNELRGKILPAEHPKSVRVRMVSANVINSLYRSLGVPRYVKEDEVTKDLRIHLVSKKSIKCKVSKRVRKHIERMNWEVLVVEDPAIEIFCSPGGKLCVHTGSIESYSTDAELASDIAHEIGHLVARHSGEKRTNNLWFDRLKSVLSLITGPAVAERTLYHSRELPLLRRTEYEADHIGILLMASAGYDPRAAPRLWRKRSRLIPYDDENDDSEYSHPSSLKRAKTLEQESVMNEALSLYREASKKDACCP